MRMGNRMTTGRELATRNLICHVQLPMQIRGVRAQVTFPFTFF
jgi:hypothetical protein